MNSTIWNYVHIYIYIYTYIIYIYTWIIYIYKYTYMNTYIHTHIHMHGIYICRNIYIYITYILCIHSHSIRSHSPRLPLEWLGGLASPVAIFKDSPAPASTFFIPQHRDVARYRKQRYSMIYSKMFKGESSMKAAWKQRENASVNGLVSGNIHAIFRALRLTDSRLGIIPSLAVDIWEGQCLKKNTKFP